MRTARVFRCGNSQAVRIPKDFRLPEGEVEVTRSGGALLLRPRRKSWAPLLGSLGRFTTDFMGRARRQPRRDRRSRAFS
jgi:antitoxin VapB